MSETEVDTEYLSGLNCETEFTEMEEMFRKDFQLNFSHTKAFLEKAGLTKGSHVLEIGCGFAYLLEHYKEVVGSNGSVTLVDPGEGFRQKVEPRLGDNARFLVGTAESNGNEFRCHGNPDGYDLAIVANVLQHVPDVEKALKSIGAKLRSGGRIVIFDFICNTHFFYSTVANKLKSALQPDPNSAPAHFANSLTACGFAVTRVNNYVLQGRAGSDLWKMYEETVSFMLDFAVREGKLKQEEKVEILTKELPAVSKDKDAVLFSDVIVQVAAEKA